MIDVRTTKPQPHSYTAMVSSDGVGVFGRDLPSAAAIEAYIATLLWP